MELPFYASHLKKKELSEDDKVVLRGLVEKIRPHAIFAAGKFWLISGDLADPHGTHRKCL